MDRDFYTLLEEKLSLRLENSEHKDLLKQILQWYKEGGLKRVETELIENITLILEGLSDDVK